MEVRYTLTGTDEWDCEELREIIKYGSGQQSAVKVMVSGPLGMVLAAREAVLQEPNDRVKDEDAFYFGYSDR